MPASEEKLDRLIDAAKQYAAANQRPRQRKPVNWANNRELMMWRAEALDELKAAALEFGTE